MNGLDYTSKVRFLSRQWWLQSAKTLFWVALVTLLVWVYADMEYTDQEEFKAILRLTVDKDSKVVLVSEKEAVKLPMVNIRLSFELRGNRKILDRFKRQLSTKGGVLEYEVTGEYGPGTHAIDAAEIVEKAGRLGQQGLTLLSTSEPTVAFILDNMLTKRVEVNFVRTGATLDGKPVISPAAVPIEVTAGTWDKIIAAESDPRLDTASIELTGVPTEDGVGTTSVALTTTLEGFGVELDPRNTHVTVTFRIAERMGQKDVRLSVRVQAPPEWGLKEKGVWTTHALERKTDAEWRPTVKVSGPQKDLEKLLSAPTEIDAYIKLNDGDRDHPNFWASTVVIQFPANVNVRLVGPAPKVYLRLVERAATPPAMP